MFSFKRENINVTWISANKYTVVTEEREQLLREEIPDEIAGSKTITQ